MKVGLTRNPLSDIDISARTLKPRERAYEVYNRDGLFLMVNPRGSKLWGWRYCFDLKQNDAPACSDGVC